MNTLVTHLSVDLDCIASCWLIKRYLKDWKDAEFSFVSAGQTLNNNPVDSDPHIIHVDTGLGRFDHHQLNVKTSSVKRIFAFLLENDHIPKKDVESLERIVSHITEIDHFGELFFPEPLHDRYEFSLHQIIAGLKQTIGNDHTIVQMVFPLLDAVLQIFKNKSAAMHDIQEGYVFESRWGKSLIMSCRNDESIRIAQKKGYQLVITKDKDLGYVRIKLPPHHKDNLHPLYKAIKILDKKGSWYYHNLGHMLLNGSSKKTGSIPSPLSIKQLIEITKKL